MFNSLGLGVRLDLVENVTRNVDPIIRDLERLRAEARATTEQYNAMSGGLHNSFGRYGEHRRQFQDMRVAMGDMGNALNHVSDRLVRATYSAAQFGSAMNSMQATGNLSRMYNEITRVQRVLGNMGFGMTQMQRDMADGRAYNALNVQMRDLEDRIKHTKQAIKEMNNAPNSSQFTREIAVAQRALQAYENQLRSVNSAQVIARTNGMQLFNFNGREQMMRMPQTLGAEMRNMFTGAMFADVQRATQMAYNSIDKTGKMMVGLGNTYMETKMKVAQFAMTLQMSGMALTQFATAPIALAVTALGTLMGKMQEAQNKFQAMTLAPNAQAPGFDRAIQEHWADKGGNYQDIGNAFGHAYNMNSDKSMNSVKFNAERALQFKEVFNTDLQKSISDVRDIREQLGVSDAKAWDMYYAASTEIRDGGKKKSSFKGAQGALDEVLGNPAQYKELTDGANKYADAMTRVDEALNRGSIDSIGEMFTSIGSIGLTAWGSIDGIVKSVADSIKGAAQAVDGFLASHPKLTSFASGFTAIALGVAASLGPIFLLTGVLLRFKGVIEGASLGLKAMSHGGLGVLSAQALMAQRNFQGMVVAFARFPQTLLSTLPLLYSMIRMVPALLLQIARINPVMTGLTVGFLAYKNNWLGFGDLMDATVGRMVGAWTKASDLFKKPMGTEEVNKYVQSLDGVEKGFAKIQTVGMIAWNTIRDFGKESVNFTSQQKDVIKALGLEGVATTLADLSGKVERFWKGFKDGFGDALKIGKEFVLEVWDKMYNQLQNIDKVLTSIFNGFSKLFGGSGDAKNFGEAIGKMTGMKDGWYDVGKAIGYAVAMLAGFKILKTLFSPLSGVANRFRQIGGAISGATQAVRGAGAIRGAMGTGAGVAGANGRPGAGGTGGVGTVGAHSVLLNDRNGNRVPMASGHTPTATPTQTSSMHGPARPTMVPLPMMPPMGRVERQRQRDQRSLSRAQQRSGGLLGRLMGRGVGTRVNNEEADRIRSRGTTVQGRRDLERGVSAGGRTQSGQAMYQRRQGRVSRALFGQAYDTYDNNGRRRNVLRQGGLLNPRSNDTRVQNNASPFRRATVTARRATRQATSALGRNIVQPIGRTVTAPVRAVGAGVGAMGRQTAQGLGMGVNAVRGSRAGQAVGRGASAVARPITQTVRFVAGRLNTAGVIRQAQTAGQTSGNRFTNAFKRGMNRLTAGQAFRGFEAQAQGSGQRSGNRFTNAFRGSMNRMSGGMLFRNFETQAQASGQRSGNRFTNAFRSGMNRLSGGALFRPVETQAGQAGTRAGRNLGRNMQRQARANARWNTLFTGIENTAGRVGGRAGRSLGRAVTTTARAGISATRIFGGVVTGAASAGTRAGGGMVRGIGGVVTKGIPKVFMLGFRAIPILGWALMAWDIIVTIFTNWDAIVNAAKTAWNWIKNHGKETAIQLYESIKEKLGQAWDWVKEHGWDTFKEVVKFAGECLLTLVETAGEIAMDIGQALWEGITTKVGEAVDWAKGKLADLASNIPVIGGALSSALGGGSKKARGGIVNAPTFGVIGEAGPEAIIPLSGNMRGYASNLLHDTASMLGFGLVPNGGQQNEKQKDIFRKSTEMSDPQVDSMFGLMAGMKMYAEGGVIDKPHMGVVGEDGEEVIIPTTKKARGAELLEVARQKLGVNFNATRPQQAGGQQARQSAPTSEDNSINISNFTVQLPESMAGTSMADIKRQARYILKELQRVLREERRRNGKSKLTFTQMIDQY